MRNTLKSFDSKFNCQFSKKLISSQLKLTEANKVIASPSSHTNTHIHSNRMHLTYTEKGKAFCRVENETHTLKPGTIHFVYPNEVHEYHADPKNPYRTYFLHLDCIGEFRKEPRFILVEKKNRDAINQIFYKLFYIHHYYGNVSKNERIFSLLFELFAEISDYTDLPGKKMEKPLFDEDFFMDVLSTLYTPPFSNPGIDLMAARKNMSRRTFTRVFRKNTGMSVVEYLSNAKLTHAKYLLLNSDLSIKQIAAQCGYANSQNLRRALKDFTIRKK